jgi:hypothetical protein
MHSTKWTHAASRAGPAAETPEGLLKHRGTMPTTVGRSLVAMRIRSDSTQSPKVRIPSAPVQLWLAVAALLGGCLVVLAARVGTRPSAGHNPSI